MSINIKKDKIVIHAVHEKDAEKFWKKLELKAIEKCFVCGIDVTAKTFGAVAGHKGRVVVCCEHGSCFYDFNQKVKSTS